MDQNVSKFFEFDVPAYAAYDNTRKISSYIDGLKISMRKIIYTMMDKYPGKEKIKTDTIANVSAAYTCYIHGSANLGGVCNTLAQSFVGANNYPLLSGNSSGFGTRINPECAATRYSSIALSDLTKSLFNDFDNAILEKQYFEGSYIEPKYFMPVFPVIFLNGSTGLSTGFSQTIYPRNPKEIVKYINRKLDGVKNPKVDLLPWFRGFTGKVELNNETGKVECFGVIVKNNMTSYTISELPMDMTYQKYIEILNKLCDNGTIVDYDDLCDTKTDTIKFDIKTTREFTRSVEDNERKLYETFKLIKTLPETLCCLDEDGKVREFNSVEEILDAFMDIRLKAYPVRKQYMIDTVQHKLDVASSKYIFCNMVVNDELKISKVKKVDIISQLEKVSEIKLINDSYDYLLNMPIHSITFEKMEELKKQIDELKEELNIITNTTIEQMWKNDLKNLEKAL